MADNAPQTQYRNEYIHGFEQRQSLLRMSVTTEAVYKGNQAIFLVADSGGATANTRGLNGRIPARADNNAQYTCVLTENHDLVNKSGFNIFQSQGDQRLIMQRTSYGVINRTIDQDVLTGLSAATVTINSSAPQAANIDLVMRAQTVLGNAEVPFDGNVWAIITPAFLGYLMQLTEFSSADFISVRPYVGDNAPRWKDQEGFYRWNGINWIVHPNLAGAGTSNEICYMYHKNAIGHAANVAGMDSRIGYDEEQDYSWARCSIFMGSKLLQNSGVVKMHHDGSALTAD